MRPEGFVYFARIGDLVKIGCTRCVASRLKQHREKTGLPVQLLFAVAGDFDRERAMQAAFKQYRTQPSSSLEYFAIPAPEMDRIKDALCDEPGFTTKEGELTVSATFFIPRPTHRRLKAIAFARPTTVQQLLEEAVDEWLGRSGEPSFHPERSQ